MTDNIIKGGDVVLFAPLEDATDNAMFVVSIPTDGLLDTVEIMRFQVPTALCVPDRPGWDWYWREGSNNPEDASQGPFPTREAAIEAGRRENETFTVLEARRETLTNDIFSAEDVLESFSSWNEDHCNPDGDDPIDATVEQKNELVEMLQAAFALWRHKHKLGQAWAFAETRNEEIIVSAECPF